MRIISGKARGTKINSIENMTTRPTLDRVKESLFNIIQYKVNGSKVLDLFAGSGAIGIEALSRGANKSYFCDLNKEAVKVINQNLEKTKLAENAKVICKDFKNCLNEIDDKLDIIFIDPPYKADIAIEALKIILENKLLEKDGLVIIETDEVERDLKELEKIEKIKISDQRKYGRANLIFIKEEN